MNTDAITLPKVTIAGGDETMEREVTGILYALELIRRETGHGSLVIEIKEGRVAEMKAAHSIRPKYLSVK